MIYEITNTGTAASLFGNWEETLIWSCLQGVMGKVYADALDHPSAAMALIGDFTFFAGTPNAELTAYKPANSKQDFMIMVPSSQDWERMILQIYGNRAKVVSRYATKKERDGFDIPNLEKAAAALPRGYELHLMDERLYHMCRSQVWSADLVSQFRDYEEYRRLGLGAVITAHGRLVSGASSYTRYLEGIEIEIDTREEYRRRGLAHVCGARLILECLHRKLYPSWDAQNKGSLSLAEKLGYHYSHTYTAVEIRGY